MPTIDQTTLAKELFRTNPTRPTKVYAPRPGEAREILFQAFLGKKAPPRKSASR